MAALEYIRTYINKPLAITKGSHDDHLDKLEQNFTQLRNAGLKVNVAKLFFCMQETKYLWHILTRGGVSLNLEKCRHPCA
jgi:hypothetical protein